MLPITCSHLPNCVFSMAHSNVPLLSCPWKFLICVPMLLIVCISHWFPLYWDSWQSQNYWNFVSWATILKIIYASTKMNSSIYLFYNHWDIGARKFIDDWSLPIHHCLMTSFHMSSLNPKSWGGRFCYGNHQCLTLPTNKFTLWSLNFGHLDNLKFVWRILSLQSFPPYGQINQKGTNLLW